MKKRILSLLLALTLLIPTLSGVLPGAARAEAAPAVALWINGIWCAAENLSGSGETWVRIPIDKSILKENDTNYVRITTNVANGETQAQQASLYFTDSTWSNSFLSEQIWVDDNWTGFTDKQANFYIAGWNGSAWQRIHDDIDTGYKTDSSHAVGKNSDGTYTNYARNIWTGANTLERYTNCCVMIHMNLGTQLQTHSENIALFPAENYHACELCDACGGCKDTGCVLHHTLCTASGEGGHHCDFCPICGKCRDTDCGCTHEKCNGDAAIRMRFNGKWYGTYVNELKGKDGEWVSIPVEMDGLTAGSTYQLAVSSNIVSGGNMAENSIDFYATNVSEGQESFLTNDRYCDGGWNAYSDRNVNVKLEGWDGHNWIDLNQAKPTYGKDQTTVLGQFSDGTWYNPCRNIVLGDLTGVTAIRASVQLHIGRNLAPAGDYSEETFATFPEPQQVTAHEMCPQHPDSCAVEGCPYHTCGDLHHCEFCPICGRCRDADCGCAHEKCPGEAAIRMRLNGKWYGTYINDRLGADGEWVSIPVEMDGLTAGSTYQLAVSSNIVSGGNMAENSIDFYATNVSEGQESFLTNDRYCDGGWNAYSDRNVNVKLEGWDGHNWIDLNQAKPTYGKDQTTVLGQFSDGTWYNPCRNIVLGDLTGVTAIRASVQLHIGRNLAPAGDYSEETFATFPEPQQVTAHEMCPQHPDSCAVEGCPYHTCGDLHHCEFCPICGRCRDADCGCAHEKCTMDGEASLRVRVNQYWYGLNISGQPGTQWVYVPVDITKLNQNGENHLSLSSNVSSLADNSVHSLDVLFTATENGDSFVTNHRWCDENWTELSGKNVNMMLQLYDGTQWVNAREETYETELHTVLGLFQPEGKWYNYSRHLALGELTQYSAARVAVQVHIGECLDVIGDYAEDQFATFLNTKLAAEQPSNDAGGSVIVHRLRPETPAAPVSGSMAGRENAHLRVRVNGAWYETALDGIETDENGMAWVTIEFPASALRSSAENQVLVSSDVNPADAYSGNSVDLFATGTAGANSFLNVNDYYDDWTRNESGEWNILLEASADGETWDSLTGTNPTYCDATYQLGRRSDGSKSHAAKNIVLGDTGAYLYARLRLQVHIGDYLGSRAEHTTTPPTPSAAQKSGNGGTPLLWVRVNGVWQHLDLTDYMGTNGQWVTCPVDMNLLRSNAENYFGLTTNVVSYGDFTDSSVDFYATRTEDGFNSFLTNDPYSDNHFAQYQDRNINLLLELFDGEKWVTVPAGETYAYDEHTVLGLFGDDGTWYNAARNLMLGDLNGYRQARIRVMMHVGSCLTVQENLHVSGGSVLPVSHSSRIPEENPAVREIKDNEELKLRVRVNGQWFETALQPYKGQKAVWVPVEIDLGALKAGEENYFHISSTALNYGSHSANSVDLYYSNANTELNSFLCADEYCDNGWVRYNDRNFNIRLELFNGSEWIVAAPGEESYYDGSVPIGYKGDENDWSNAARNMVIGSLEGYSAARIVVQLHVGSSIAGLDDPVPGETVNTIDRNAIVGMPEHAPVTEPEQPEAPLAESGTEWIWIAVIGAAAALIAAGVLILVVRKKKNGRTRSRAGK